MPQDLLHEPVAIFLTIMAVILIAPLLSEFVHLPGIVGLILGGMLIGPHGLKLLDANLTVELLSTVGLIYLMFNAGLEVDLRQFSRVRNKALLFGGLTFVIPQVSGMLFGRWLGLSWPGAVLLGSAFASHTLIAFPILTRLGVVRNEAVSVTIGATVFTDISAFLVLAVIAGSQTGESSPSDFAVLVLLMLGYAVLVLLGLPRLGKLFFRRFSGPAVEFQFVIVGLFVNAFLAELIGMHAVVGAFLTGLAINSTLPHRSAVIGRVLFMGEAFFIPIFLIYSGMITDVSAFATGPETLLIGLGVTAIAYLTKLVAALLAGRLFHYSRDELFTVWGLSQAQAAVTLPTLLVGVQLGLFTTTVFNGAILMILLTSITSPLLVQRYAARLKFAPAAAQEGQKSLFDRILVPIADAATQANLIDLTGILARSRRGTLLPCNVALKVNRQVVGLDEQAHLLEARVLHDPDTQVQLVRRVDTSIAQGILHAAIENDASLIALGWRGKSTFSQSLLGSTLDRVVWDSSVPVLVGRLTLPVNATQHVVLVLTPESIAINATDEMLEAALNIARTINVPLHVLADSRYLPVLHELLDTPHEEHPYEIHGLSGNVVADVAARTHAHDLVMLATTGSRQRFRSSVGRMPEQLAEAIPASMIVVRYPPGWYS